MPVYQMDLFPASLILFAFFLPLIVWGIGRWLDK
jgi:hypothetical protein